MAKKYSAFIILIAVALSAFGLFLPAHANENISIGATVTVHVDRANQQHVQKSHPTNYVPWLILLVVVVSIAFLSTIYLRSLKRGGVNKNE